MQRWITQLPILRYSLLYLMVGAGLGAAAQAQEAMALPQGRVGTLYSQPIKTEGGLAPFTWRLSGGQLPPGLAVSSDGKIEGTPTGAASQSFLFEVTLSDSSQPPQTVTQRFSISIAAAPLRIVGAASTTAPAPLQIIAPIKNENTSIAEQISYSPTRPPHFVIPLITSSQQSATPKTEGEQKPDGSKKNDKPGDRDIKKPVEQLGPLDPAKFTLIYEDTKTGKRQAVYEPPRTPNEKKSTQLVADYESSIIIVPKGERMGEDVAFNKLYITAKLASGDTSKDVVVNGYSEVGKDQATMAAQSATAFQSAANVQAMDLNMAYVVSDIVDTLYQPDPQQDGDSKQPIYLADWMKRHQEIDFRSARAKKIADTIAKDFSGKDASVKEINDLTNRLRLYQPEIQAISDFLLQKENLEIVEKLGVKIFWIDRDSMVAIAQQYKTDIQVAFDSKSIPQAKLDALQDLLERTKLVYQDFGDIRQGIIENMRKDKDSVANHTDQDWQAIYLEALQTFAKGKRIETTAELKQLLATGSISLTENKAKDGDRLTITVQSVPAGSTTGGIPVVFEVAIKKFGAKVQLSPSFLFIRRLGVTDAEATPPTGSTTPPLNRVNFAPSPGMTFGIAYFKRGQSWNDKFLRGLGPGAGINVTFMNFNDPGYNLATNQFTNTNGTNVQVGAGLIGSLFDDKIQFSYGWDLNVEKRRTYFGVGFGFIEIGKELAKYIPK